MAQEKMQLIQELWREDVDVPYVDLVLEEQSLGPSFGKNGPTYPEILHCFVFIRVTHPELIPLAVVMKDAPGKEVMTGRIGNICVDGAIRSSRYDDCLLVVIVFVECEQEGRLFAVAQRTGQRAFIVGALLRWLSDSECVSGVKERVTIQEVGRAMELWRSTFGCDLDPSASRPRVKGSIGV